MIRTRFAPSPTGLLHVGGVRTALYAWALTRRHGGTFALRIEDTDAQRATPEAERAILNGLAWLGLDHDGPVVIQSQNLARHRAVAEALIASGHAFRCWDTAPRPEHASGAAAFRSPWRGPNPPPPGDGPFVVRFRSPTGGRTVFEDAVKGRISTPNAQIEDWVMLRSDGQPTYNFAAVVDDADAGMTHVVRGDDHVANTPKQIHLYQALGKPVPVFAHLPLILDENGKKLSKRRPPEAQARFPTDVAAMRELGLLPEALLNYLARLGWAHDNDEVFSLSQFVAWFDLADVQRSAARIDPAKLHWVNTQHLKRLDDDALWAWVAERGGAGERPTGWPGLAALFRERGASTQAFDKDAHLLADWLEHGLAEPKAPEREVAGAWQAWLQEPAGNTPAAMETALRAAAKAAGVPYKAFATSVREALTDQNPSLPITAMLTAMGTDGVDRWREQRRQARRPAP